MTSAPLSGFIQLKNGGVLFGNLDIVVIADLGQVLLQNHSG